jgi:hypothetical protein
LDWSGRSGLAPGESLLRGRGQAELARHLEAFPPVEVEIDDETNPRKLIRRTAKLIFLNTSGDPLHRGSWSRA